MKSQNRILAATIYKNNEIYQRHKLDYIIVPTKSYEGRKYIHYQLPYEVDTKKFISQIKKKKYIKIEDPNFDNEGFGWLGTEKTNKIDELIFKREIHIIKGAFQIDAFYYLIFKRKFKKSTS